jgi:hypothetical protein
MRPYARHGPWIEVPDVARLGRVINRIRISEKGNQYGADSQFAIPFDIA